MRVFINGQEFSTGSKPIVPYPVQALPIAIRDTGEQRRQDSTLYTRFFFNNWTKYGLGFPRMRRDRGFGLHGMRDADAETRFDSGLYLPYLAQGATDPATGALSRFALDLGSNVWLFWDQTDTSGTGGYASSFTGSTTTWGAGTGHDTTVPIVTLDGVATRGVLGIIYLRASRLFFRTWDGSAWGAEVDVIAAGNSLTQSNGFDRNAAKIVELDDNLYVIFITNTGLGRVRKSTDGGATWATVGVDVDAVELMGATVWFDLNGDPAPVWHTDRGIYALDVSASVVQTLRMKPSRTQDFEGEGMAVANGRLYVPTATGGMTELSLIEAGVLAVNHIIGPALTTARTGFIRDMKVGDSWIFTAYDKGRTSGGQPGIYAWDFTRRQVLDGKVHIPVHSMHLHATSSRQIQWLHFSTMDDNTSRLHFAVRLGITADVNSLSDELFIAAPLVDPATGATINYETDGYVEIALDDMGDPHVDGAIYESLVEVDDLSATATTSDEYLKHLYGVDGAAYTTVTLGNYLSGTKSFKWGTGELGVTAKTISHRIEFYRNTAGTPVTTRSPKLRELEYRVSKNLNAGLLGWFVPVDIGETARLFQKDTEQVISDIETILASTPLVTFSYGKSGTKNVHAVPGARLGEFWAEGDRLREEGRRTGVAELRLQEVN